MSQIIASLQNVSKQYILFSRPQDRLKQSLFGHTGKIFGTEFWALHNINLEIPRGTIVGVIGQNGSGKSTLLQVIAGILGPTQGTIQVQGRIATLLELGTGFNPEFTGRENVYLNGAILGYSRKEIDRQFQRITDFADIGQFIDQPVKWYSNGMFVRLAFSVQALLEPELLVVDEVFAVGDTAFQFKCMNWMKTLVQQGCAVVLATHDIQTVRSLCDHVVWIAQGKVKASGRAGDVSAAYLRQLFSGAQKSSAPNPASLAKNVPVDSSAQTDQAQWVRWGSGQVLVESVKVNHAPATRQVVCAYGTPLHIQFQARVSQDISHAELGFGFAIRNVQGLDLITATTFDDLKPIVTPSVGQVVSVTFDFDNILAPGNYALVLAIFNGATTPFHYYDYVENAVLVTVESAKKIYSLVLPRVTQTLTLNPDQD